MDLESFIRDLQYKLDALKALGIKDIKITMLDYGDRHYAVNAAWDHDTVYLFKGEPINSQLAKDAA